MIDNFIRDLCILLQIPMPIVSFDTSNFTTPTMMAQFNPEGDKIYLRKPTKLNPDFFFAIAHELRHIWQMKNDREFYFLDYLPVELLPSVEEYNLQPAEVDANAFAGLVMINFFHVRPLYQGLPDNVRNAIFERIDELKKTPLE